jgi:molybdenum cofactor cytidylyltransferase
MWYGSTAAARVTSSESTVAGLVLAAGFSRRFGSDKRLSPHVEGGTLLAASLRLPCAALPEVWAVLRPDDDVEALGLPSSVITVCNPQAALGMGHSLACGVQALAQRSGAQAVAIFLGDMPWISRETLSALLAQAAPERIVVPTWENTPGHPVIFGRRFWPALQTLTGDTGARAVVQANAGCVRRVAVNDPGILRDVDTPPLTPC